MRGWGNHGVKREKATSITEKEFGWPRFSIASIQILEKIIINTYSYDSTAILLDNSRALFITTPY